MGMRAGVAVSGVLVDVGDACVDVCGVAFAEADGVSGVGEVARLRNILFVRYLNGNTWEVFRLRAQEGWTFSRIGDQLGISRQRAHQLFWAEIKRMHQRWALQNHVLERRFAGQTITAIADDLGLPRREVSEAWRAGCERLAAVHRTKTGVRPRTESPRRGDVRG
jgi:sigma-70-like protein